MVRLRGRQVYAGAVLGESAAHPHIVRKGASGSEKTTACAPWPPSASSIVCMASYSFGVDASVNEFLPASSSVGSALSPSPVIGGKPARRGQGVIHIYFKMTLVAGGSAGAAYVADDLPLDNMLSDFHSIALQVGVQGAPAVALAVRAVVDDHKVAQL